MKNVVRLPVDSVVVGVTKYLGEVHLKIQVHPHKAEVTTERFFYAYSNGEYMKNPNLGFIDSIRIGQSHWFVFEDDFYYDNR